MDETQRQADEEAIGQLFRDWAADGRRADAEALAALVTEDAEFWTQGAAAVRGRDAVRATMAAFFERFELAQDFEREELLLDGDLALVRGVEINRMTPRDGFPPLSVIEIRQRAFSILLREADGAWRFARGMTNRPPDAPSNP
jgi:uncharacterized protein (TIGR02246 family)